MRAAICCVLLVAATSAHASGFWVDKFGRIVAMEVPGADATSLQPGSRSLAEAFEAFEKICASTNFDKAAAGGVAEALGWGFAYRPEVVPFKPPVDIGGWRAPDAQLNVANGIFFSREPQCNLTVALSSAPDRAAAIEAISARFGAAANAAKAVKKDGSPNPGFQPEWRLPAGGGSERTVFVHVHEGNQIQFALIERKGAK